MKRQSGYKFDDDGSGRICEYMDGLGPRHETDFSEPVHDASHLVIGSREFRLDKSRNPVTARILLVEGDLLVRAALAALVRSWKTFHVVAEARTIKQALAKRHLSPDVVLLSLAGAPNTDMITDLSRTYGPDRLIVLLGQRAEEFRFQISRLSHRVLMKNAHPRTLKKAIGGVPARQ